MSIARSSRPLRSMTIGINGIGVFLKSCRRPAFSQNEKSGRRLGPVGGPTSDKAIHPADRGPLRAESLLRRVPLGRLGAGDVTDDLVDQAVFLGLDGGHVAVALGVLGDPLQGLVGVLGQDLVDVL